MVNSPIPAPLLDHELDAPAPAPVRTCRSCGCTDDRACINDGGVPCHWVDYDLCSACV